MPLTIVAHITAATGKEDFVFENLKTMIAPTRAEAGCLQYDLHRDNENPAYFMFFENWESRDLWQDHIKSPHVTAYRAAVNAEDALADFKLHEMTKTD